MTAARCCVLAQQCPSSLLPTLFKPLIKLNFEVLEHPPYSPGLVPSNYHLFGPLKQDLRGSPFTKDQQVKETLPEWLVSQSKTFCSEGIKNNVWLWNKSIQKQGDYVEK
jgi:histone-lysine N-methyltransferase SETMAR